jgi:diguanylate cyclase (GGDEF)-like protein
MSAPTADLKTKIFSCIFSLVLGLSIWLGAGTATAHTGDNILRIGYVSIFPGDSLASVIERHHFMGYIDAVESYGTWKCELQEYPDGNQALEAFQNNEIDILAPVELLHGSDYGRIEGAYLMDILGFYAVPGQNRFKADDLNTMQNIKVGTWNGRAFNDYIRRFLQVNQLEWQVAVYNNREECINALHDGAVDVVLDATSGTDKNTEELVLRFASINADAVFKKENPKAAAIMAMISAEKFKTYIALLSKNNASMISLISRDVNYYNRREQGFIKSAAPIKVAVYPESKFSMYNCYSKDGSGIYVDVLNAISADSGLKFEFVECANVDAAHQAVLDGKADITIDTYDNEKFSSNFVHTRPFLLDNYVFLCKYDNDYSKNFNDSNGGRMGIYGEDSSVVDFMKRHLNNKDLKVYFSLSDLYSGIETGKLDTALVPMKMVQSYTEAARYPHVMVAPLDGIEMPTTFSMSKNTPQILSHVLNKAIVRVGRLQIEQIVLKNTKDVDSFTISALYQRYPLQAGLGMGLVLLLIAVQVMNHSKRKELMLKNQELEDTMADLNRANAELSDMNNELNAVNIELKETTESLEKANQELKATSDSLNEANFEKNNYKFVSETDKLTGVLNKAAVETACQQLIYDNVPGTLMIIDLDHFKQVNDKLGHQVGDQILTMFAIKLSSCLRNADIAGRFGGDEFIVYAKGNTDKKNIEKLARRINDVARSLNTGSDEVKVSASIGIAIFPDSAEDYDELFKAADKGVYIVKEAGKDGFHIYEKGVD